MLNTKDVNVYLFCLEFSLIKLRVCKVSEVKIIVKLNKLAQEGVIHNFINNQPIEVATRVLATTRTVVIRIIFTNNRGQFFEWNFI